MKFVVVDVETTGLDPSVHEAYEVAWAVDNSDRIRVCHLPHTLEHADPFALQVGGYHERGFKPRPTTSSLFWDLQADLLNAYMVGANPAFDASFLRRVFGYAPWKYRLIDVEQAAMWQFEWDEPRGLAAIAKQLREGGYDIPEPNHTATGDVATTQSVFYALRDMRTAMQ